MKPYFAQTRTFKSDLTSETDIFFARAAKYILRRYLNKTNHQMELDGARSTSGSKKKTTLKTNCVKNSSVVVVMIEETHTKHPAVSQNSPDKPNSRYRHNVETLKVVVNFVMKLKRLNSSRPAIIQKSTKPIIF